MGGPAGAPSFCIAIVIVGVARNLFGSSARLAPTAGRRSGGCTREGTMPACSRLGGCWSGLKKTFRSWKPVSAASGAAAARPEDTAFDLQQASKSWIGHRDKFPAREGAQVCDATDKGRPGRKDQKKWHHYRARRGNGQVCQEWWLTPLFVPASSKKGAVKLAKPEHALMQYRDPPTTSGGGMAWEHFTNIHRIEQLAEEHPMVTRVRKKSKNGGGHQSPMDLHLYLMFGTQIYVGCSVHKTGRDLLSLWWSPAEDMHLEGQQEALARAVFFDLMEAEHDIPDFIAGDYLRGQPPRPMGQQRSQAPLAEEQQRAAKAAEEEASRKKAEEEERAAKEDEEKARRADEARKAEERQRAAKEAEEEEGRAAMMEKAEAAGQGDEAEKAGGAATAEEGRPPRSDVDDDDDDDESGIDSGPAEGGGDDEAGTGRRGRSDGRPERRTRPRSPSCQRPTGETVSLTGAPGAAAAASVAASVAASADDLIRAQSVQEVQSVLVTAVCGGGGDWRQDDDEPNGNWQKDLVHALDSFCDPIPDAEAFVRGLRHYSHDRRCKGQLWSPVSAIASKKMHYLTKLGSEVLDPRNPWRDKY